MKKAEGRKGISAISRRGRLRITAGVAGFAFTSAFFILHSAFTPQWLCWRFVGALWTHEGRMGVA